MWMEGRVWVVMMVVMAEVVRGVIEQTDAVMVVVVHLDHHHHLGWNCPLGSWIGTCGTLAKHVLRLVMVELW
jgi:hypothetical protein